MKLWYLIFLIPLIVLFIPISLNIMFSDRLDFFIRILGAPVFDYNKIKSNKKDQTKYEENQNSDSKNISNAVGMLDNVKQYLSIITEFLKILNRSFKNHLKISNLDFSYKFGLGDAATTGIFSGAVYTAVSIFYTYIVINYTLKKHKINIQPDFNNTLHEVSFNLKIKMNLYSILKLLYHERNAFDELLKIIKKDGASNDE